MLLLEMKEARVIAIICVLKEIAKASIDILLTGYLLDLSIFFYSSIFAYSQEGFDLVPISRALNSYVNIFNIYGRFWTNSSSI